jgi:predicted unusual protein kinase regulating ubiquinone biosynthesis (AarF/ABC1/UbiB family)
MNRQTITPPSTPASSATVEVNLTTSDTAKELRPMLEETTPQFDPVSHSTSHDWNYDPRAINAFYRNKPWQVVQRLFVVLVPCLGFVLGLLWDKFRGRSPKNEVFRAVQLRKILTELGPTYIKIGQALSTRPDLVPPVYLEELTLLQDQLPPFPNEIAYQFITHELYDDLTAQPIAAASLGQVYKGKLKTGEPVAVKVQRPDLLRRITIDIYIVRYLALWATKNIKQLRSDLVAILDEFAARIFEEMDYGHEGRNAERFANLYGHLPDIYVPKIYWEYTGRRVLTMEWIEGTKLTNVDKVAAQGVDAGYLVEVGVQCSLRQLLEHGFFHADPPW